MTETDSSSFERVLDAVQARRDALDALVGYLGQARKSGAGLDDAVAVNVSPEPSMLTLGELTKVGRMAADGGLLDIVWVLIFHLINSDAEDPAEVDLEPIKVAIRARANEDLLRLLAVTPYLLRALSEVQVERMKSALDQTGPCIVRLEER